MLVKNSLGSSVEGRFWVQQLCVRAGGGEGSRGALVSALCRALVLPTEAGAWLGGVQCSQAGAFGSALEGRLQGLACLSSGRSHWENHPKPPPQSLAIRAAPPSLCGPAEGKCWIRIWPSASLCCGLMPLPGTGLCAPTGLVPTQASPCRACGQPRGLFPSL